MDEIRRKLALIDEQLAGGALRRRLVSTAPLFFPALGLMTGIVLQDRLLGSPTQNFAVGVPLRPLAGSYSPLLLGIWLAAMIVGAVLTGTYALGRRHDLRPEIFAYGALLVFTCLGAIRWLAHERVDPRDIRHLVGTERVLATVRGCVLTPPRQEQRDWCFARLVPSDPSSAFYMKLEGIKTPTGWQQVVGTIRVQVQEPVPNLDAGDYIQVYCWLDRFQAPTNPGQFNFAKYLQRRGVLVGASVPVREAIEGIDSRGRLSHMGSPMHVRRLFTGAAARGLLDHPFSESRSTALLEALLLGQRRNIDRGTHEAFRRTGLLHLISLSGMHMGILIGIVWWLCKPIGFSKRIRALICILATAVFLLIVPPLGPILRAAVIVWAYCASILLRRRTNPVNSLSLAALVLLLIQPTQLFEAGWQLSFASVAGILTFSRRIEDFVHESTYDWFHRAGLDMRPMLRPLKTLGHGIIKGLSVGAAAWLASAGILLYHYYNFTPLAGLWTVLAAPLVTGIVVLGFLKIVLSFFLPTLSLLLGGLLALLADLLTGIVEATARIDFSYIQIGQVPLLLIVLYYSLVLVVAFLPLRRPILKRSLCIALALSVVVPLGVMKWQRTHRADLRLTCLDVGHGQAILAQLPGATNLLFDTGSLYSPDVGARIVIPCLDYLGVERLHAIVASHHDVDHINGIPEIVSFRRVDRVYLSDSFFAPPALPPAAGLLRDHLEENRIRAERVPETLWAGPAQVRVLWPAGDVATRDGFGENDNSLVCLIEFAGRKVLLCSDIEKPAQEAILKLYPALKADVVIVPHHGSARTLDEAFLGQLEPSLLVYSCGRSDYERGRVLRITGRGRLLFTAQDGATTVYIDRAGRIRTTAGRS